MNQVDLYFTLVKLKRSGSHFSTHPQSMFYSLGLDSYLFNLIALISGDAVYLKGDNKSKNYV